MKRWAGAAWRGLIGVVVFLVMIGGGPCFGVEHRAGLECEKVRAFYLEYVEYQPGDASPVC